VTDTHHHDAGGPGPDAPESLGPALREAVRVLREAPEPSAAWRTGVTDAAWRARAAAGVPRRRVAAIALAASLAGVLVGGGVTWLALRPPPPSMALADPRERDATTVRFTLVAPTAARVQLVGDFNRWDPERAALRRGTDGRTWEIEIPLAPGRYEYSFLVDGVLASDPAAPRAPAGDFGAPNSIVFVRGS
jgi:hypothetical protein